MIRQIGYLSVVAGTLAFASSAFAQTYQMELTGVGTGVTYGNVYVSPYVGTISSGGKTVYTGYLICDDFNTDSTLNSPWTATASTAASGGKFNGSTFTIGGSTYSSQQMYGAVAYLATQLLGNLGNAQLQTDYSFAIWDIMDGQSTNPYTITTGTGTITVSTLIKQAFAAGGAAAASVDVFTASPVNASQEFLVVGGPAVGGGPSISTPEPVAAGVLGANLVAVLGLLLLMRRRRGSQAA